MTRNELAPAPALATALVSALAVGLRAVGGCGESTPAAPTSRPTPDSSVETSDDAVSVPPAETTMAPATPGGDDAYRIDDLTNVEIPKSPARGKVNGRPFEVEKATLGNGILEIRQGADFFPDRAFSVFLFTDSDEMMNGRSFIALPDPNFGAGTPHIHMNYMAEGKQLPETEMFMQDYAMRLVFGVSKDGRIPGAIYLCVPDEAKSYVVGTFEAEIDPAP